MLQSLSSDPIAAGHALNDPPLTRRRRVWLQLNPRDRMTPTVIVLVAVILLATVTAIAETELLVAAGLAAEFRALELLFAILFTAEYAVRIWAAPEGGCSRWRYARTPAAVTDLIVVVGSILPFVGANIVVLRLVRLLRIVRLAKIGRYSRAFRVMEAAIRSRASHLWVAFVLAVFFLVFSATLIYWAEGEHQPELFGSIPRSMWWATVTMTTVGYGDVVPLTPLGKFIGGLIAMGGIALIAIPTGILAAAFSDELAQQEAGAIRGDR